MSERVLVGILNYNAIEDCLATVESLRALAYPAFDLVVVDNASSNDAAARVAAGAPGVRVEVNAVNGGFAGGMNSILDRALAGGYDYCLLSNNDVALEPDALTRLVATARAHPRAALVGAVEVGFESGAVRAVGGTEFNLVLGRQRWLTDVPAAPAEVAYPQGACFLVAMDAVRAGLRLDDALFMYFEEVDLGFRLRALGRTAMVDPAVRVRHKAEARGLVPRNGYFQQRNRLYLVRKHGSLAHAALHVAAIALVELPLKAAVRVAQGERRFARACVAGFVDGLRGHMGRGRAWAV